MRPFLAVMALMGLAACAAPPHDRSTVDAPARVAALLPADVLLLGEQHDAPDHQQWHRDAVVALAQRGVLAALALEMVEQGGTTSGVPRDAGEARVREMLRWPDQSWPWSAYGPAVMAAVRAGAPVFGANLPREALRSAMADTSLDKRLDEAAWQAQRQAVRDGHCQLLPEARISPMTRAQVARDRAMAETLLGLAVPGKTVVLLAGAGHVDPAVGVPRHLPPTLTVRALRWPAQPSGKDHCAGLREQLAPAARP